MSLQDKELFEFDGFRLEAAERLLLRDGKPISLEPKVFDTLLVLLRHSGRLVSKEELMQEVWPDSFVEEVNLARNISILRKALQPQNGKTSHIETVPKRGYRFVSTVRTVAEESTEVIVQTAKVSVVVEEEESNEESKGKSNGTIELANEVTPAPVTKTPALPKPTTLVNLKHHKLLMVVAAAIVMISSAIAIYHITPITLSNRQTANAPIDSIAVLPFENAAQDPNVEYLTDGITQSLINRLSLLSNLKVMSSSSVFRYKGKEQDAQKIGSDLNVRAVLTGNVKQIGNQLVITVSLDDAKDNRHIWGEQYVRKLADVLAIQNEIAQEVSTNLRGKLTGADERQITKRYTDNVEAYQLYLKGLYEWNKHTQADLQKSIDYYKQALEKDPNYALAYFGLAACYGVMGNNYVPPREAFPIAKAYAAKALALDDTLAEAHHAMGTLTLNFDWDFAGAERELLRAQALDPNFARAHQMYGDCMEMRGRFDEAQAERKRALELDPLSPAQNMIAGCTLYYAGQYDEAVAQLEKTIYLEPHNYPAYLWLGQAYEQKKLYEQAIKTYQMSLTQGERQPQLIAELGHVYALAGKREKALNSLAELREMSKQRYVSPYSFAVVYAGLGDKEQTFSWLEKAYQDRSYYLLWLKVEPLFNSLRSDTRFQDLLQRIGLTS